MVGFGLVSVGCETKSTDEQLKDNTAKDVEQLKKSISENTSNLEREIKEEVDKLKNSYELGRSPMKTLLKQTLTLLIITSGITLADADGPDYFKVKSVASNDVLNMRSAANPHAKKVGEIPPASNCVKNLGCKGGLTMSEFTDLSNEEKAAILRKRPRWCHVEYRGVKGWVSARYLIEGTCKKYSSPSERAGMGKFDATGNIPCVQSKGQPMGQCPFGVARGSNGSATVSITLPDGRKRAIFFENGTAASADLSQADGNMNFNAKKQADLFMINSGNERYEIPEAVVFGG